MSTKAPKAWLSAKTLAWWHRVRRRFIIATAVGWFYCCIMFAVRLYAKDAAANLQTCKPQTEQPPAYTFKDRGVALDSLDY